MTDGGLYVACCVGLAALLLLRDKMAAKKDSSQPALAAAVTELVAPSVTQLLAIDTGSDATPISQKASATRPAQDSFACMGLATRLPLG